MHNLQYGRMQLDEEVQIRRRRSDSSSLLKLYKEHQECKYMSSDNEYEIRELRKEIDYLAEDVEKLKRLVKNIKDVNSLKLTADNEEYLRGID
jgi:hypothetical protein